MTQTVELATATGTGRASRLAATAVVFMCAMLTPCESRAEEENPIFDAVRKHDHKKVEEILAADPAAAQVNPNVA